MLEPRRRRADHVPRLAPGRRRGVRLRRARSARSRHRLRRQGVALRSAHRPGAERRRRSRCAAPTTASSARSRSLFSPVDPRKLYFASNVAVADDERRPDAGPRSAPTSRARRGTSRRTSASTSARRRRAADAARRHLHDRAVVRSTRTRIWAGTDDGLIHVTRDGGKTWTDVTPPRSDAVGEGLAHRRVALRREHRVRRGQHAPPRRPAAAHLPHARRRQDLDAHHARHSRRRHHQRRARRSEAARPALRRHRAGGVRVVRRRRALAVAAAEHAGDVDPRSRDQGRRPRRRHARPVVLDPRRHHAAAADRRARRRRRRAHLFQPQQAWRFRWNKNTDTPLPPDEPAGQNPPDGAIINYWLPAGRTTR